MRFLEEVAIWLQKRFQRTTIMVVTKGKSIISSQEDNQPMGDDDVDTTKRINIEEEIRKMLTGRRDANQFRTKTKQGGRGFTQIMRMSETGK